MAEILGGELEPSAGTIAIDARLGDMLSNFPLPPYHRLRAAGHEAEHISHDGTSFPASAAWQPD